MISFTPESLQAVLDEKDQIIATERAAREQAEKRLAEKDQIYLDRLDAYDSLRKRNEQVQAHYEDGVIPVLLTRSELAEARLAEAMVILKKVSESCAGDRYAHHGFGQLPRFIGCSIYQKHAGDEWCCACEAMAFRIATTPVLN